jgi:hypothetical protein
MSERIRISELSEACATCASASAADIANSIPEAPGTQIPTEMLAKQRLDVGLVVDHQNQDAQL